MLNALCLPLAPHSVPLYQAILIFSHLYLFPQTNPAATQETPKTLACSLILAVQTTPEKTEGTVSNRALFDLDSFRQDLTVSQCCL